MYTSFVSLGAWCQTAHNLERCGLPRASGLFDWNFTKFTSLYSLIEGDFCNLFERDNLRFCEGTLLDQGSGIGFHHAFARNADGVVTDETIDAGYVEQRGKIDHLVGKWFQRVSSRDRYLYVWTVEAAWLGGVTARSAATRLALLMREKYPRHLFDLLVVDVGHPNDEFDLPGVFGRRARVYQGEDSDLAWTGDAASWDRILSEFKDGAPTIASEAAGPVSTGIRLARPERRAGGAVVRRLWPHRLQAMFRRYGSD